MTLLGCSGLERCTGALRLFSCRVAGTEAPSVAPASSCAPGCPLFPTTLLTALCRVGDALGSPESCVLQRVATAGRPAATWVWCGFRVSFTHSQVLSLLSLAHHSPTVPSKSLLRQEPPQALGPGWGVTQACSSSAFPSVVERDRARLACTLVLRALRLAVSALEGCRRHCRHLVSPLVFTSVPGTASLPKVSGDHSVGGGRLGPLG